MKKILTAFIIFNITLVVFAQESFSGVSLVHINTSIHDKSFVIGENIQSITDERDVQEFYINAYETCYELWYSIKTQAKQLGYIFQNPGQEGSEGLRGQKPTETAKYQPVTTINWRDAIVWCNAFSEIQGRIPCYTYKGSILRDSTNAALIDLSDCNYELNGYRLPTETEWEYVARKTSAGFQRGDLVSGAVTKNGMSDPDALETTYCWNELNSTGTAIVGTAGSLFNTNNTPSSGYANAMGIFDMSGNVLEFCNDWYENYYSSSILSEKQKNYDGPKYGNSRVARGGSWSSYASYCYCGDRYTFDPDESYNYMGFRFCTSK